MEIGIYTLGDLAVDPSTNETIDPKQRMEEVIEAAKLADDLGLDVFGVGEHHRLDFVISTPAVVLSAIARETKNIRLTSATTVLSTTDPVRLYEEFATVDLLSQGRAEMMAGRGAFLEPFELFGYELAAFDGLFKEHMDLFLQLNRREQLDWEGKYRAPLKNAQIAPRAYQKEIPVWIGVGGSVDSAVRAGTFGSGLAMAILSGDPERFIPLAKAYKKAFQEAGHDEKQMRIGVTGHGFIAETSEAAHDIFYPYYKQYKTAAKKRKDPDFELTRELFESWTAPEGALFVGSPEEIADKIVYQHEHFGHDRCLLQLDVGGVPFEHITRSIELLANKVVPMVKERLQ